MKISPHWIRDFVSPPVDDHKMAEELTATGTAIEGFSGEGEGLVYEAEVTTNRVDAMNHYGIAREVSAIYDVDLKPIVPKIVGEQAASKFKIEIKDPQGCARYTARIVRGVKVGPSPEHVVHRLELIDQRSISNVTDATNYVLNELGQPTHAFDLDKLDGGKIVVRRAREGELLKTLDGVERKLTRQDLVIADGVKAVALAGVMGGYDTMISEQTRNVLIESAWFDPGSIRRTSRRLGMHTDASHRFERGADFGNTPLACARVAELVQQMAGGKVEQEIDAVARVVARPRIELRRREVRRILGVDVADQEIARILRRLGFGVTPGRLAPDSATTAVSGPVSNKGTGGVAAFTPASASTALAGDPAAVAEQVPDFLVEVPTWRLDVEREIDLIEEIARIYGYLKLPNTLPAFAGAVVLPPNAEKHALLRQRLLALGYNESVTSTFIAIDDARAFTSGEPVRLENPVSEEAACLRSSLLPGITAQVNYNLNRGNNDVRLFECSDIFLAMGDRVDEKRSVVFAATGAIAASGAHRQPVPYGFYEMKGDMEALLSQFEHRSLYYDPHVPEYFHPGRAARAVMDGTTVARFGQLHPELAARRKLRQEVYVAEILVDRLFQSALRQPSYQPVSRFPAVERDFSFLFDAGVLFERIRQTIDSLRIPELQEFKPVEIFHGGKGTNLPAGKYAMLLRARFQAPDRTLRDDEVAAWAQQIIQSLEAIGGKLRG
ncbi:MAG: phenylalanine--tRNA ligase subunit beta [Candidatus Korobacteraceae bacterium]